MLKLKSRVIVKHSKNCFMKGDPVPFSGIPVGTFFGSFAANEKVGGHHFWIKVTCNDPNCPAIKAVSAQVLREA
jgi:hypothetical protein